MILDINRLLIIFGLSIIIYLVNSRFFNSYKTKKEIHQKYINDKIALPIGGFAIFLFIIFFNFFFNYAELFFFTLILIIGLLSDYKLFNSPKKRLLAQTFVIILFLFFSKIEIMSTRINFFDDLLSNIYINLFFTAFCILILINGTNFIDGLNGLVIGYYTIILIILLNSNLELNFEKVLLNNFLFILASLFFLNFFNVIFLGDNGSYLLGFLFSIYLIKIHSININMSPYFVILLLWYPCIENLFSIVRKMITKVRAVNPDTDHLHHLLFSYVLNNFKIKNKLIANNFSSILINTYNLTVLFIGMQKTNNTGFQLSLILFNILFYVALYIYLLKKKFI